MLTRIGDGAKAAGTVDRPNGNWFSVNAAAGPPFRRITRLPDTGDGSRWAYAPDFIHQGRAL